MFTSKFIDTEHKDLVHDVAYDLHGKRMATSSCDQYVKIWDLVDDEWRFSTSFKAHNGIVWKAIWAYPEFGPVLATCSNDKTVAIWEEIMNDDPQQDGGQWMKRGNLVDSKSPIVDVKFSPRHFGLKLAMVSIDGNTRVYEAQDTMNLCQWTLQGEIQCKYNCSCLDWSPSRLYPPLLLIGCDDTSPPSTSAPANLLIYEHNDALKAWVKIEMSRTVSSRVRDISFSPNLGRSHDLVAVAGTQLVILQIIRTKNVNRNGQSETSRFEVHFVAEFSEPDSQIWRLAWNLTGTVLASSADDGTVKLWKGNQMDAWKCISVVKPSQVGVKLFPATVQHQLQQLEQQQDQEQQQQDQQQQQEQQQPQQLQQQPQQLQQQNISTVISTMVVTSTTNQQALQQPLLYSQTLKNTKSSNTLR
ncbi:hypothetical protein HELRODRAFT_187446 [Helobdella robusta]|uniref:Nucleoporin SEH1 n=1 Tax=Helobdella robusta TaxID=6412 RepID=T1FP98_HELRO|nr:hypothetical protein HELRODRAFT_187446 [Helobdella robusta]ESN94752.1 hypothetical protein HELRODRAFT_187446 [Helobdella robusta]